jgi:hypothetical protein
VIPTDIELEIDIQLEIDKLQGSVLGCVAAIANLPSAKQLIKNDVLQTLAVLTSLNIPQSVKDSGKKTVDDIFGSIP